MKGEEHVLAEMTRTLQATWGHTGFRAVQRQAILAIMNGQNVFVRMATGGGKSLCYQVPGMLLGGTTLVISPLVSLMRDQVAHLTLRGVSATYLGSAQTDKTVWDRLPSFAFLYVTPELIASASFDKVAQRIDCKLIAVDEAHCIAQWGNDFRPDYLHVATALSRFPKASVVAVTATATRRTQEEIVSGLRMEGALVLRTTIDRHNLAYAVQRKSAASDKAGVQTLDKAFRSVRGGSIIVYAPTVKEVDALHAGLLDSHGCAKYHAQMTHGERERAYRLFSTDGIRILVATTAFGMGVDKPDVRAVFHWGPPKSVEEYYQQSGRAGRDGEAAQCCLWHSDADWAKIAHMTKDCAHAQGQLTSMRSYCSADACRRRSLALFFEEDVADCGVCDWCVEAKSYEFETRPATAEARNLLEAIRDCSGRFGTSTILSHARGLSTSHEWLKAKPSYGKASAVPLVQLKALADDLIAAGLVDVVPATSRGGHVYCATALSRAGRDWLNDAGSVFLRKHKLRRAATEVVVENEPAGADQSLIVELEAVRTELAFAKQLGLHAIMPDARLRILAQKKPLSISDLKHVVEMGDAQVADMGAFFVNAVRRHQGMAPIAGRWSVHPFDQLSLSALLAIRERRPTTKQDLLEVPGIPADFAHENWETLCEPFVSKYFNPSRREA